MTLHDLIIHASERPIESADLQGIARGLNLSDRELCDAFARRVAEGYLQGDYPWQIGDGAMNRLHAYAYVETDTCLSDFARQVFEAFDEGEYVHSQSPDLDGEPRTKALLAALIGGAGS